MVVVQDQDIISSYISEAREILSTRPLGDTLALFQSLKWFLLFIYLFFPLLT